MFLPRKPFAYASATACSSRSIAERELAPDVDERVVRLDRERGDDDALDDLVRVALEEHVVLERGRLALVAVHREVARVDALRQERPLLAGRRSRRRRGRAGPTPSPARPGSCAGSIVSARRSMLVAAGREVPVDRPRVVGALAQPLGDDARLGHCHQARFPPETPRGDARARAVLLDDRRRGLAASRCRGTRSSPGTPARCRTRRGTRPLRPRRRRRRAYCSLSASNSSGPPFTRHDDVRAHRHDELLLHGRA